MNERAKKKFSLVKIDELEFFELFFFHIHQNFSQWEGVSGLSLSREIIFGAMKIHFTPLLCVFFLLTNGLVSIVVGFPV